MIPEWPIYELLSFLLIVSGIFGGGYIGKRAVRFWKADRFLSVLDIVWSATLFYLAVYFFALFIGLLPSSPLSQGLYVRPALVFLVNIPVIITISRR